MRNLNRKLISYITYERIKIVYTDKEFYDLFMQHYNAVTVDSKELVLKYERMFWYGQKNDKEPPTYRYRSLPMFIKHLAWYVKALDYDENRKYNET